MKLFTIIFAALYLGCSSPRDPFNVSNYVLRSVDSFNNKVGSESFYYKYDTLRKMRLEYFADGKLMAKIFTYNGKMDGNQYMYELDGKTTMLIDSFSNGVKIKSTKFYKTETDVKYYKNGIRIDSIPFDSL
jgi:antitoxin component YwqK of YwqJK toxin-antitoxin module